LLVTTAKSKSQIFDLEDLNHMPQILNPNARLIKSHPKSFAPNRKSNLKSCMRKKWQ